MFFFYATNFAEAVPVEKIKHCNAFEFCVHFAPCSPCRVLHTVIFATDCAFFSRCLHFPHFAFLFFLSVFVTACTCPCLRKRLQTLCHGFLAESGVWPGAATAAKLRNRFLLLRVTLSPCMFSIFSPLNLFVTNPESDFALCRSENVCFDKRQFLQTPCHSLFSTIKRRTSSPKPFSHQASSTAIFFSAGFLSAYFVCSQPLTTSLFTSLSRAYSA